MYCVLNFMCNVKKSAWINKYLFTKVIVKSLDIIDVGFAFTLSSVELGYYASGTGNDCMTICYSLTRDIY